MKIKELMALQGRPALYEPGTAVMWTDGHISGQLLAVHLDTDTDLASRRIPVIEKTVDWILSHGAGDNLKMLDLGCGPGLYTERFAGKGHRVTGVDFSENSLEYARKSSGEKGLSIDYHCQNYLELELPAGKYDLVVMIYEDFAVLSPEERSKLLSNISVVLKPGGMFIFDVPNDSRFHEKQVPPGWECAESGFWRACPYLSLSRSYRYEEERVILIEHLVCDDGQGWKSYRFWNTYFSHERIERELGESGFEALELREDILPEGSVWTGDNVTFVASRKKT